MRADLTDAELDELADRLDASPTGAATLDLLELEGYLVGTLAQPSVLARDAWLPPVFSPEPLPATVDADWLDRTRTLIERRREALNAAISEDGWFDPMVADIERLPPLSEYEPALPDISRALLPWVSGFQQAQALFGSTEELTDPGATLALARIYRHLPAENDEQRELQAAVDRMRPLANLDDAVGDLVDAAVELWDLSARSRFAVETIRRAAPKVGRNDPCPCGNGRKYKLCHGK